MFSTATYTLTRGYLLAFESAAKQILKYPSHDIVAVWIALGDQVPNFVVVIIVIAHRGGADARVADALTSAVVSFYAFANELVELRVGSP